MDAQDTNRRIAANLEATDRICDERGYGEDRRKVLRSLMEAGWGDFRVVEERTLRNRRRFRSTSIDRIPQAMREDYIVEVWFAGKETRFNPTSIH